MRAIWIAVLLIASLWTAEVKACLSNGPDGYTHGLIWQNAPSDVPDNAIVIRVRHIHTIGWGHVVKVLKGPRRMVGRRYRIAAEAANSCVGLGELEGFIVVRKKAIDFPIYNDGGTAKVLAAIEYAPSAMNEVLRFFGGANWRYPGDRGEGPLEDAKQ